MIFGAGKIGRSFIGQLFGCSGYKIVFIDTDPLIVESLNNRKGYQVIIKGETDDVINVTNVQAVLASEKQKVVETVSTAGILAVCVGKNSIESVIPLIAGGLEIRYKKNKECPLDIIIAENMRDAAGFLRSQLRGILPSFYPVEKLVGLIETSIGKMVPIMARAEIEKDPLMVYAEPYNTLILDGRGFKLPIPDVKGLAPENNIKAWVDRKAFIHNLGHATAAYFGHYKHPEAKYIFEILDDAEVYDFTREVMLQSAVILHNVYPEEFEIDDLTDHIDDLLFRFRNRALRDTIYRVGHDLVRKLSSDDRFMGAIRIAVKRGLAYDRILKAMSHGLYFRAKDEEGNIFRSDLAFLESIAKDFRMTLLRDLHFDDNTDGFLIGEIYGLYMLNQHVMRPGKE